MRGSRVAAALLAVSLGLVPLAPPEHVHETDEHGHHERLVHRHFAGHTLATETGTHVEDDDAPVLTLSTFFVVTAPRAGLPPPLADLLAIVEPPAVVVHYRAPYVEPVIHGPPRAPASLRAPPRSPAC